MTFQLLEKKQVNRQKKPKNPKENSCDLPTKTEKEAAEKKMANLNQSKRGKKKNYTLKEIEEMYPLFKKTGWKKRTNKRTNYEIHFICNTKRVEEYLKNFEVLVNI